MYLGDLWENSIPIPSFSVCLTCYDRLAIFETVPGGKGGGPG